MASGKFYAWTNFDLERNEWGQTVNVVHVGDEVTQQQLNVSDEQWNELVATGAVSEEPYPEDIPADVPPVEYLRQKVLSGEASDEEAALVAEKMAESGQTETAAKRAGFNKAAESEEEAASMAAERDKQSEAEASSGETSSSSSSSGTTPKTQTASSSKSNG